MRQRAVGWLFAAAVLAACDAADDVQVQPLPSLEAASPEARAGLPVVSGTWRFAGWELAPGDTARVGSELPGFGELRLETQRLDSIAGFYVGGAAPLPVIGEVRRDSVLALAGGGGFLTGRITADTLWLVLTSLVDRATWPGGARAAFVRAESPTRFVRVKGQRPVLAVADSVGADSLRLAVSLADSGAVAVQPRRGTPLTGAPFPPRVGEAPPSRTASTPVVPRRGTPLTGAPFPPRTAERAAGEAQPGRATSAPQQPRVGEPAPSQATETRQAPPQQQAEEPAVQEEAEPEPQPEPARPRRTQPRLLGVPVDSSTLLRPRAPFPDPGP